ncbi:MAG: fibrobacter succinogenes major paralogous domain-containing protein [Bacteroidales bacterium]|jgi:uncharacterized protein (TIGR02145 family)|nr:fibrobacter succinogenes major paralogous domain-containing protein [Bacteroidales bacterium]
MVKKALTVLAIIVVMFADSCKKDSDVPPDPPDTNISGEVVSVEQSTVVISGTAPTDAKEVGVCWDTVSNPTIEKNHLAGKPVNGKFSITISRLLSNKQFYARIYAADNNGVYIYSTDLPFKTKVLLNAGTSAATSLGLHDAVLNGYAYLTEGVPLAWWFEYGETISYGSTTPEQTITGTGKKYLSFPISGLNWHQAYHFKLMVRIKGETFPCADLSFVTLGNQPAIGNIIIDNEELDHTILKATINPNLITTTVVFEWGKTTAYGHSVTLNPINGSTGIEVSTEIAVEQAQEYHFRVKAENVIGVTYGTDTSSISLAVIDAAGNKFHACKIGDQYWLTANWRTLNYNNGDPIPNITDPVAWGEQIQGALCFYNNDPANFAVYGPLYNWYVISDPRGICPPGWHVPTWDELYTLYVFLDEGSGGGNLKEAGLEHWYPVNAYGTNSTGFTALPGGCRGQSTAEPTPEEKGAFHVLHEIAYFWTSDSGPSGDAWMAFIMGNNGGLWIAQSGYKYYGNSLRVIKD